MSHPHIRDFFVRGICGWVFFIFRNCSVPSQLRAKIHWKLPSAMGFLPASPCFHTVSAVNAQTYWTVTSIQYTIDDREALRQFACLPRKRLHGVKKHRQAKEYCIVRKTNGVVYWKLRAAVRRDCLPERMKNCRGIFAWPEPIVENGRTCMEKTEG